MRVDSQKAEDLPRLALVSAQGHHNSFRSGTGLPGAETLGSNTGAQTSHLESEGINSILLVGQKSQQPVCAKLTLCQMLNLTCMNTFTLRHTLRGARYYDNPI